MNKPKAVIFDGVELRTIPGVDDRYMAGSDGNIYSFMRRAGRPGRTPRPTRLACGIGSSGLYLTVSILLSDGRRVNWNVHMLVCLAFHGPRPESTEWMTVSHLNGDSRDCSPGNLAWETAGENSRRKVAHGTADRGFNNSRAVLTPSAVSQIKVLRFVGWTHGRIAELLGVSRVTVSRVLSGKRYANG